VGAADGLASERRYTFITLPEGIYQAVFTGRPARAAAIIAGLLITCAGYAAETAWLTRSAIRPRQAEAQALPVID
jgi:hypothetical protein